MKKDNPYLLIRSIKRLQNKTTQLVNQIHKAKSRKIVILKKIQRNAKELHYAKQKLNKDYRMQEFEAFAVSIEQEDEQ